MTHCVLRQISAVTASLILVLAVAGPAFASFGEKDGTIWCPSRPTYLSARYQGNAVLIPPGLYALNYNWNDYNWHVSVAPGMYDGGYWYAVGTPALDVNYTFAYCR